MAHCASYALTRTDWRDLEVATCALMLVRSHSGQPVRDDTGAIAFHDDGFRSIGLPPTIALLFNRCGPGCLHGLGIQ